MMILFHALRDPFLFCQSAALTKFQTLNLDVDTCPRGDLKYGGGFSARIPGALPTFSESTILPSDDNVFYAVPFLMHTSL